MMFLSLPETADLLNISTKQVISLIRSGQLQQAGIKRTVLTAGKYKGLGNRYEPLSKDAHDYLQSLNDYYYTLFIDAIARNRGITAEKALSMADGKVFIGQQALDVGLVDAIGSFDFALQRAVSGGRQTVNPGARATAPLSYAEMVDKSAKERGISRVEAARLVLSSGAGQWAFLDGVR